MSKESFERGYLDKIAELRKQAVDTMRADPGVYNKILQQPGEIKEEFPQMNVPGYENPQQAIRDIEARRAAAAPTEGKYRYIGENLATSQDSAAMSAKLLDDGMPENYDWSAPGSNAAYRQMYGQKTYRPEYPSRAFDVSGLQEPNT